MSPNFLIDVPPPTISGVLHMGHVFSYCQMDLVARFQAMQKKYILYPSCYDCNGLPTEKLAHKNEIRDQEKIIDFAERTWENYENLFKNIKINWSSHHYHTFDSISVEIALKSFEDLKNKGYLYKDTRDYYYCPITKVSVSQAEIDENGCYERSGAKVELRSGEGWFINMLDHLPKIREAIDSIEWHPDIFRHRLHRWLDDIKFDWSISRERNFGIPIPGEKGLVFDTWFTSSLSPQRTWASHTKQGDLACPIFDIRFQAHDIIRTWALFTIVKSLYHNSQIPWKSIVISGHALDSKGRKISKTAGNFTPPAAYLDQFGCYGLRYWASHNTTGNDTRIDTALMSKGKKVANKIRNANKFLQTAKPGLIRSDLCKEWENVETVLIKYMETFRWSEAIAELTAYFWDVFCSKYIEECKLEACGDTLRQIFDYQLHWFEIFIPGIKDDLHVSSKFPSFKQGD